MQEEMHQRNRMRFDRRIGAGAIGGIIVLVFLLAILFTERVPAGYTGIVYHMTYGIGDETLGQGVKVVAPWNKLIVYATSTEQAALKLEGDPGSKDDHSFNAPTSDGKSVNVDLEFSYHFDIKNLPTTYTKFKGQDGRDIEANFIKTKIKTWSQEITAKYSVIDIYGSQRSVINTEMKKYVQERFAAEGIIIEDASFSRIEPDQATKDAIQATVNAQQELKTAEVAKQKAQIEAEKNIIAAEGAAKVTAINAQAAADANTKMQDSLTELVIQKLWIEKWNGTAPTTTTGSNTMVGLPVK